MPAEGPRKAPQAFVSVLDKDFILGMVVYIVCVMKKAGKRTVSVPRLDILFALRFDPKKPVPPLLDNGGTF